MKQLTADRIKKIWDDCLLQDKSIEYFIQYAGDVLGVDNSCIINWISSYLDGLL